MAVVDKWWEGGAAGMGSSPPQVASCLCLHNRLSRTLILNLIVAFLSLDRVKHPLQVTSNYYEDACGLEALRTETLASPSPAT
ncbi:hypothetical protein BOTCAL_0175g00240 [Botryotinia calthae]|uniref:Uncharacterized protein n=1 Tax=Botryotinia calthae TaxID=38488 RepID=A0A4Y8D0U4_9HELO|nr:hypothetical protein BOTCAL_0175g00240 [Botryotinia calthae]